jgi:hypothetical protein
LNSNSRAPGPETIPHVPLHSSSSGNCLPNTTCSSAAPTDWLIGVNWKTSNPTPTTIGTLYAASVALDATGNIWVGAGTGALAADGFINEFNQAGQLINGPISTAPIAAYTLTFNSGTASTTGTYAYTCSTSYALGYARPFGIAVDTSNNAWFASFGAASPGTFTTTSSTSNPLISGVVAEVSPTGTVTGYLSGSGSGALAIDGSNNIFVADEPVTGRYYLSELTNASTYATIDEGIGRTTGIYNGLFVDKSEYAWTLNSTQTCGSYVIPRANNTNMTTAVAPNSVTQTTGCGFYGAPDSNGNAWVAASGNLYYINIATGLTTPTVTTVSGSIASNNTTAGGTGGLANPNGLAVDGAGNIWAANRASTTTGVNEGLSEFSYVVNTNNTATVTTLSPGGNSNLPGVFGFQVDGAQSLSGLAIDSSGNIWLETTAGSYLYHMVGAAAPVVTPNALALKNGTLATRP